MKTFIVIEVVIIVVGVVLSMLAAQGRFGALPPQVYFAPVAVGIGLCVHGVKKARWEGETALGALSALLALGFAGYGLMVLRAAMSE